MLSSSSQPCSHGEQQVVFPKRGGSQGRGPQAAVIYALPATEAEKAHLQLLQHVALGHPEAQFWLP